jgi:hypothetical protein
MNRYVETIVLVIPNRREPKTQYGIQICTQTFD